MSVALLTHTIARCRENGIIGWLVVYVRAWVRYVWKKPLKKLALLSQRFTFACRVLGLRGMHRMFEDKHGRISSCHYRAVAEVLEVIVRGIVDEESPMGKVIHTTIKWYWATRAKSFTQQDLEDLQADTDAMDAAWKALDTAEWRQELVAGRVKNSLPKSRAWDLPKFHRGLHHMVDYIRRFGPVEYLTTETSESLHKYLKQIFRV